MGVQSTLSGFNPTMGVPPGGTEAYDETTNPYGLQTTDNPNPPAFWQNYGGYDTPEKRGIANMYGPEYAWGNAGMAQPMVMPPEFNMPGAPATQGFANTAYQTPWNTGGIGGLASGPNSFIPTPTGGAQPMADLLARQRETYLPMLTGTPEDRTTPVTPPPGTPPGDPPPGEPNDPNDPTTPTYPGDETIEEYINNWLRDNPFDVYDYFPEGIPGLPEIDPSMYMTNQNFQDWLNNYQPNIDMSNYMTNQTFDDYMGGYTPNIDMSNYMTNQAFDDYMGNYQPDLDMSQYVTQGGLNNALQGLGSLNTNNPSVADYSYNVNPFTR